MSVFDTRPEKRIAADHTNDRPTYVGTDQNDALHYWSIHDRRIVVVQDDAVATTDHVETAAGEMIALADADRPLRLWRRYTARERGWVECRITADPLLGGGL